MTISDYIRNKETDGVLKESLSSALADYHGHEDYASIKTWDEIACGNMAKHKDNGGSGTEDDTDRILSDGVVQRFIKAHNIHVYSQKKTAKHDIYYVDCINSEQHTINNDNHTDTFISVSTNGMINFHCNHTHCDGIHWKEYKRYYEARDGKSTTDTGKANEDNKPPLKVRRMSEIEIKQTEFLYKPMFPKKVCALSGYPGAGKTYILCQLVSSVSNGKAFFTMEPECAEPQTVIYFSSEDGYEDTIAPRLLKCGANMDYVICVDFDDDDNLDFTDKRIEGLIELYHPALVLFDTLQNYIGDVNMNAANETTRKMRPLVRLADTYDVCIVFVNHFNKNEQGAAITRTIGSTDIIGKCRSYMTIGNVPNEKKMKYLSHEKTNVGKLSDTILFSIGDDGIRYEGSTSQRADDFAQLRHSKKGRPDNALDEIKKFIVRNMPEGKRPANEMLKLFTANGFSDSTVKRAKKELNIRSELEGYGKDGIWFWKAPENGFNDQVPIDYALEPPFPEKSDTS